jgi:hypothetical protein
VIGDIGTGKDQVVQALLEPFPDSPKLIVIEGQVFSKKPYEFFQMLHDERMNVSRLPKLRGSRPDPDLPISSCHVLIHKAHHLNRSIQEVLGIMFDADESNPPKMKVVAWARRRLFRRFQAGLVPASFFLGFDQVIFLPRLSERLDDIPFIVPTLLSSLRDSYRFDHELAEDAIETLQKDYFWPGNVWELNNFLYELCMAKTSSPIHAYDVRRLIDQYRERASRRNFELL